MCKSSAVGLGRSVQVVSCGTGSKLLKRGNCRAGEEDVKRAFPSVHGLSGMYRDVLGCTGMYWDVLGGFPLLPQVFWTYSAV